MSKIFLITAGLFGLLFLIFTPPFQVPDEQLHFYRAYEISSGVLIEKKTDAQVGDWLPRSVERTVTELKGAISFNPDEKITASQIISHMREPLERGDKVFVNFPSTAFYSPVGYMPPVLGISIDKIFNLSPLLLMYLGRLANLLVWLYLTWLAIRLAPVGKWIFFLLALTPMILFQAASLSPDALTNGLAWLAIALYLRYALSEGEGVAVDRALSAKLIVLGALLALVKPLYFVLAGLFLFIPPRRFSDKRVYFGFIGGLLAAVATVSAVWSGLVHDLYVPLLPKVSAVDQARHILSQPFDYALTIARSFKTSGIFYLGSFVGRRLGWLDTKLPWLWLLPYYGLLFLAAIWGDWTDKIIRWRQRILMVLVFLASAVLVMTSMYVTWTPVGESVIKGVQGRYAIPVAPLLCFLVYNFCKKLPGRELVRPVLSAVFAAYPAVALSAALYYVIQRYYY